MKDKFYTPEAEELHVGFECEMQHTNNNGIKFGWHKVTISQPFAIDSMSEIRVRYLCKEDIERLGFTLFGFSVKKHDSDRTAKVYKSNDFMIIYFSNPEVIEIRFEEKTIFSGEIKNISELKRILKQIGYGQ